MALPEDHLVKFYKMADAKEMWEAIKSRFGGNDESKKMQKYLLKQQCEGFSVTSSEGLHKGYDRFQTLLSQLEIHDAGVSHAEANQKFLRSPPFSWSQVALIMRTKSGLIILSFDDLYNNLRVFERDLTASSSFNTQNMTFVSTDNTSSTNDVSTAYSVSSPSVSKSHKKGSSSYTDEVIHSFFANQSSAPQLDYDDLEQINDDDMEEMDLKWQVAMISTRIKKFYKRTGKKLQFDTKDPVGFDKTKMECFNCHKLGHFTRDCRAKGNQDSKRRYAGYNKNKAMDYSRRPAYQDDLKALVTIDGDDIDWSGHGVFTNKECDLEDVPVNDRYAEGMHAVPPPMTGNYMPFGPDVKIDYSKFTYGPKHTLIAKSGAKTSENATCESDSSVETTTSMPALVEDAPKVVSEPKVWTDAPIIEEYESDSNDDSVSNVQEKKKPSFAFTDTTKHVKTSRENVKETDTPNHCPKVEKQGRNSHTRKGLGYAFTRKSCFVCGILLLRPQQVVLGETKEILGTKSSTTTDDPHKALKDKGIVDSGCSKITGKGKIKAGRLNFKNIYYVEELKHYNLFFVSQMCDKKNKVLFTDTDCLVLSTDFKFPDENQGNLVRGLPSKIFENDHTCVACQKGKQHKAYLNQANKSAGPKEAKNSVGTQANDDQDANSKEIDLHDKHFVLPIWSAYSTTEEIEKLKRQEKEANDAVRKETTHDTQDANTNNTNLLNAVSAPVSVVGPSRALYDDEPSYPDDPSMPHLEDIYASPSEGIFTNSSYNDEGVVIDFNNLETIVNVSLIPTIRIHTIHPKTQILGDPLSGVQTRSKVHKNFKAHALFQIQKVWILVDFPFEKKAIGTKWVYMNKKDERRVVVRNKARLVGQGHRQEEGIDYDEVFALVARIEAIRIFLAFAYYMGFIVYQMDVKSAFLYDIIDKEVYVTQPPSFVDPKFPNKAYKKSWCDEFEELIKNRFLMSSMGELTFFLGLQTASTPIETQKPLVKDEEAADVDVRLYRSIIGSLMYLTASRLDIMFAVCACFRFQVTPKSSHLQAVKRIFRYLKGQPKLGLWYPKVSSFDLEAYSDSDYTGAILTGNSQQEVVNILAGDLFHGNAKSRLLWLLLLQRQNMLPLLTAMDKFSTLIKGRLLEVTTASIEVKLDLKSSCWDRGTLCVGFHTTPQMVINSPCLTHIKNWLVQEQTALGKDFLNPFMADILPKIVKDVVKLQALIDRKKVVVTKDIIRQDLRLDDADGVECFPTEEIFAELTRRKFNFSKYIFYNMVRNVDSPSKFLMYPRFLQVLITNQVDDLSSHTTKYTSLALTQKVFANMRRIGKAYSGVETPLFATMLVQPPVAGEEENEENEVPAAPTPPSPTHEPTPPSQEPITSPLQTQSTCTTLSHKVAALKQDKVAQALEIIKLKKRVKKLENQRRSKSFSLKRLRKVCTSQRVESSTETIMGAQEDTSKHGGRIEAIDADENITLVDMETKVDLGAELQGRLEEKHKVNVAEPTVFDDEEVTMTMAQTLIKVKAKKARLVDEQMAKRLIDEEVEQAAAREKQELDDFKRAQELQ
nr:hypothetical protein [Tanacetum cinerariifolium]